MGQENGGSLVSSSSSGVPRNRGTPALPSSASCLLGISTQSSCPWRPTEYVLPPKSATTRSLSGAWYASSALSPATAPGNPSALTTLTCVTNVLAGCPSGGWIR